MTVVPQRLTWVPAVDEAAIPLFTGAVKQLVEALIEQMNTVAAQQGIPVESVQIRRFPDNDQGCPRLLVDQRLIASDEASAGFLDRFTAAVDRWYETLPEEMAVLLIDTVLFDFRWSRDEPTR
jgi:hypothetical protein